MKGILGDFTMEEEDKRVDLDHFLWYAREESGRDIYSDVPNVKSDEFNIRLYIKRFGSKFNPVYYDPNTKHPERFFIDDHRPENNEAIYSMVYQKPEDSNKMRRESSVLHSVIINKNILTNKKLSLFDIDKAILDFRDDFDFPDVEDEIIDELHVKEYEKEKFEYEENLDRWVTSTSILDLARSIKIDESQQKEVKYNYVCDRSDAEQRKNISIYLVQLLNFDSSLYPLSFSTSFPRRKHSNLFDLVVSKKANKNRDRDRIKWTRRDSNVDEGKVEGQVYKNELEAFYKKLKTVFGDGR